RFSASDATWRADRPVPMTIASHSDERPLRSIVTMSSALSSSREEMMRARSGDSVGADVLSLLSFTRGIRLRVGLLLKGWSRGSALHQAKTGIRGASQSVPQLNRSLLYGI